MLLDEWVPVGKSEVDKKVYDSINKSFDYLSLQVFRNSVSN